MQASSRYILNIAAGIGCISMIYFLSLIAGLPFIVTILLAAAGLFFLIKWMNRQTLAEEERMSQFRFIVLLIGVAVLIDNVIEIAPKHGGWDAWAIWNLHARYLSDPVQWKSMFLNTRFGHPDYPLALPATIAFFSRMFNGGIQPLISFAIHFLITLCIPLLIYLETYKRNILVAGIALFLFAANEFYVEQGTSQYADTLLAFFFLCAIVCMDHHKEDSHMLILTAAFLGCCIWTKNEGAVLAVIFILFHFRELLSRYRIKYVLVGIAAPLIVWGIFKCVYAPANDIVAKSQGDNIWNLLSDRHRYSLVFEHFKNNLQYFRYAKWAVIIYIIWCVFRQQWPDKRIVMVFACLFVYMMIYVVSPNDLDWHLRTSQNRLMHQLMPIIVYVLAMKFSGGTSSNFQARFVSVRQRLP